MPSETQSLQAGTCCLPGDITVTKIHTGYLIGRALKPLGPGTGPWWEFIATVTTFDDAVHHAKTLAQLEDACAWLHIRDEEYQRLWPSVNNPARPSAGRRKSAK